MDLGLVKAVGVCNYDSKQLGEIHSVLAARGIPLASNQVNIVGANRGPTFCAPSKALSTSKFGVDDFVTEL